MNKWFWTIGLALAVSISAANCGDIVFDIPPPSGGFTEARPAYLCFKNITATRMSLRKIGFDITLQGDIPNRLPKGTEIYYRAYFDVEGYTVDKPLVKLDGFAEDLYASITRPENKSSFTAATRDLTGYRSKVWESKISGLKGGNDKISFDVSSDLFALPDAKIRMVLTALNSTEGKISRVSISPISDLPTQGAESLAPMPDASIR